ncbi:IS30 family transposase, partial [Enterococcus faecalis]
MTEKTGVSYLLTLTDRKSRILQVSKVQSKKAEFVTEQLIHLQRKFPSEKRISITPDTGKEFAYHKEITEKLSG